MGENLTSSCDVFLSYAHRAAPRLAAAIERMLEELGKRWDERRVLTVFRDTSKQGVSADLGADLIARLDSARYLLLLASPEAAQSSWVTQEVRHWINTKGIDRLLLALVGGDLMWDVSASRFDRVNTTALPEPLLNAYAAEPKWVDFRWAREHDDFAPVQDRFMDGIADLSAAIRGISKDQRRTD